MARARIRQNGGLTATWTGTGSYSLEVNRWEKEVRGKGILESFFLRKSLFCPARTEFDYQG